MPAQRPKRHEYVSLQLDGALFHWGFGFVHWISGWLMFSLIFSYYTLQPYYNMVVYSTNSIIARVRLCSHCLHFHCLYFPWMRLGFLSTSGYGTSWSWWLTKPRSWKRRSIFTSCYPIELPLHQCHWGLHQEPLLCPKLTRTNYGDRAFSASAPVIWNELPANFNFSDNLNIFKKRLKTFLFNRAYNWLFLSRKWSSMSLYLRTLWHVK